MKKLHYTLVDVFTTKIFGGNQLAVFTDAVDLCGNEMQQIAQELNLSETIFIRSIGPNRKKVRIFTPEIELPMAGHPTIGAAFVLASENENRQSQEPQRIIFEEGVGPIEATVHFSGGKPDFVEMAQPMPRFGPIFNDNQLVAELLSLDVRAFHSYLPVQTVSTGVPFLYVPLNSLQDVQNVKMKRDVWERFFQKNQDTENIFVFSAETLDPDSTVHSRMFAPGMGIAEDPATGAASGPLGAYLAEYEAAELFDDGKYRIISEQGIEINRPSQVRIRIAKTPRGFSEVSIGGSCVIVGKGALYLPD